MEPFLVERIVDAEASADLREIPLQVLETADVIDQQAAVRVMQHGCVVAPAQADAMSSSGERKSNNCCPENLPQKSLLMCNPCSSHGHHRPTS